MIRLIPITPELADSVKQPERFSADFDANLGDVAPLVQGVVEQNEAYRATTGAPPEWGGYLAVDEDGQVIGTCAFKGAPDTGGEVEIAYFTFPAYEGHGFGGAMAAALLAQATESDIVRTVCAHTLPEANASTRILSRLGFAQTGIVVDPEDGPVWRWERGA